MATPTTDTPIGPDEVASKEAANALLRRHERAEPEANITSAVRDFLIATNLCRPDEIAEENPPSPDDSRRAVDLTALDTFIESKRRIGMARRGVPDAEYVAQLDGYLESSQRDGKVRMGILTNGKHWVLRWPGAGEPKNMRPYAITLEEPDNWHALHEWLRDDALIALENIPPNRTDIEARFGPNSPRYEQDIDFLRALYEKARENPSIAIKRRLWQDLLRTALGEIAQNEEEMDDLFIRHTYLTTVIGIVVQASFNIDIRQLTANNPHDLVLGRKFRSDTGIEGVVESDFFAWQTEVDAQAFLKQLARRILRFDWLQAPSDVGAILYESVIPPDERRQLGEYYTPDWLARSMVREVITDPLNQTVLDPACGSGAFLTEAIAHFIEALEIHRDPPNDDSARQWLNQLRERVIGIDVHPVAVHLARAAWVLAAKPLFALISVQGRSLPSSNFSAPVHLGDSLQLRIRNDMLSGNDVPIHVGGDDDMELRFPVSLVSRAENFDKFIADVTNAIESGGNPQSVLAEAGVFDYERPTLEQTIKDLQRLHKEERNHIWAYYTRNMVRPVALSLQKVDVIIGNPPWINYNQTIDVLRAELERLSKNSYGIWQGGRYATHQDVAGLFYARSVDLYLKDDGVIGMVMPHSALQTGQYTKWRQGVWQAKSTGRGKNRIVGRILSVDFTFKYAWDLERLEPNTFFPIPASVVFAQRLPPPPRVESGKLDTQPPGKPLADSVERWIGPAGEDTVERVQASITDTSGVNESPYGRARQGATIVPRALHFVEQIDNPSVIQAPGTIMVNPRRGSQDKAPWKDLALTEIYGQTIETEHVHDVHLGETLVPYATLEPLKAVLPVRHTDIEKAAEIVADSGRKVRIDLSSSNMEKRMRERWEIVSGLWEDNKLVANRLSSIERLDYHGELAAQIGWQIGNEGMPVRIAYTTAGQPSAAQLTAADSLVSERLYWIACRNQEEVAFLLAIINSTTLYEAVQSLMSKGLFGPRDLHKHLWKLPIPEYDEGMKLHRDLAQAGETAAAGVQTVLPDLREKYGDKFNITIARRDIRAWLKGSEQGKAVERLVTQLLIP